MHPSNPINMLADQPPWPRLRLKRVAVLALLAVLAVWPGALGALTREMIGGAFLDVSVFVAVTLFAFYFIEDVFGVNFANALNRAGRAQVPIAALLGTLPGCGGAVMVVAAYSAGRIGFGAVVAALTATMGDGAFLLIATRPDAALVVLPVSLVAGILAGWVVDRLHRHAFHDAGGLACEISPRIGRVRPIDWLFLALAAPGLVIGSAGVANIEITDIAGVPSAWLGLAGAFTALAIWATSPLNGITNPTDPAVTRMSEETGLITVWVIAAYLVYDYASTYFGLDLKAIFATVAPLLPLIAVLVGFIPGCGPQVVVATMYISGALPFAALIGNAISNDGDALFPAIALNPRAAVVATLYSAVPALLIAYGFYLFAPDFLN
jgi:Putative, 10TM heavy-metal exporter